MMGLLFGVSPLVMAEETKLWSGEVSLTVTNNNGNTRSQNLGLKSRAVREGEVWRNTFKLDALNESDNDERTAEKYLASIKFDRKFTEEDYLFLFLEHEKDDFGGYDYQSSFTTGYGRKLINTDVHKLEIEVGPGYRYNALLEENDAGDKHETEALFRLASNYDWVINESATFRQELSVDAGEDITVSRSLTKLKTKVHNQLSLSVSYEIKYTSEVPQDTHKFDSVTILALDYSF
ncbi:hypothetical protein A9Q99_18655 [Gammaproteobacteria bacterium 45_16_T64]|nr:hypothetical protein A9Q99_18655 [Gammaproteobacteria bacterium 45_16_T64]